MLANQCRVWPDVIAAVAYVPTLGERVSTPQTADLDGQELEAVVARLDAFHALMEQKGAGSRQRPSSTAVQRAGWDASSMKVQRAGWDAISMAVQQAWVGPCGAAAQHHESPRASRALSCQRAAQAATPRIRRLSCAVKRFSPAANSHGHFEY